MTDAALSEAPAVAADAMLSVRGLQGWYGESHVLHGIDFDVRPGEVVTLLGRNGAGKTTTVKALIGLLKARRGSVVFRGTETIALPARKIARLGMGYVPEERGIYGSLSVEENLELPPRIAPGGLGRDELKSLFPNLFERLGAPGKSLSGGEQQMLAIARILRTGADMILLDEPTEGLAPAIVHEIGRTIRLLADRGATMILVEQNLKFAASLSTRHYVIEEGRVVDHLEGAGPAEIDRLKSYLGV